MNREKNILSAMGSGMGISLVLVVGLLTATEVWNEHFWWLIWLDSVWRSGFAGFEIVAITCLSAVLIVKRSGSSEKSEKSSDPSRSQRLKKVVGSVASGATSIVRGVWTWFKRFPTLGFTMVFYSLVSEIVRQLPITGLGDRPQVPDHLDWVQPVIFIVGVVAAFLLAIAIAANVDKFEDRIRAALAALWGTGSSPNARSIAEGQDEPTN